MKHKLMFLAAAMMIPTLAFTTLTGCSVEETTTTDDASDGDDDGDTTKTLFRKWYIANSAWSIDFTGGNADGSSFTATLMMSDDVSACDCSITLTGDETGGTCTVNSCTWNNAGSDPDCNDSGGTNQPGDGYGICNGNIYINDGTYLSWATGTVYH